jgi:hypothetical protein
VKARWLIAAALIASAAPAAADDGTAMLGKAQKAIEDIDYDGAKKLVDAALASGALDPSELARAHMLAGEVAAALGDDAGAHDHFERWILLDPAARLPDGLSPKITTPFTAAHASADALGTAPLTVTAGDRKAGHVSLEVQHDPLRMVARVHVTFDRGTDAEAVGSRVDVAIDDAATRATVNLLDEHGNRLVDPIALTLATTTTTATTSLTAPAQTVTVTHSLPAAVRWPTWTVVALVAGGGAAYFGHAASQDQSDLDALNKSSAMHSFDEAQAIADRGHRDALLANVSIGVAAAAAAAVVVTVIVDHRTVEVQPLAAPGATGAAVTFSF